MPKPHLRLSREYRRSRCCHPETPRPQLRRLRSARRSLPRPPPPLHMPNGDKGIYSCLGGRSPDDASYLPETAYLTESAQDMLAHTESEGACRSPKTEQVCCHR